MLVLVAALLYQQPLRAQEHSFYGVLQSSNSPCGIAAPACMPFNHVFDLCYVPALYPCMNPALLPYAFCLAKQAAGEPVQGWVMVLAAR